MLIYLVIGVLGALIFGVFGGVFWPMFVVIFSSWRGQSSCRAYFLAFCLGLFADLNMGRVLGTTIFPLLVVSFVVLLLKSRFHRQWKWLLGSLVICQALWMLYERVVY